MRKEYDPSKGKRMTVVGMRTRAMGKRWRKQEGKWRRRKMRRKRIVKEIVSQKWREQRSRRD
jgi:hypothetical protein